MKKLVKIILASAMLVSICALAACSSAQKQLDVKAIAKDVTTQLPINSAVEKTDADVCDYYDFDADKVAAASLYMCGSGAYPDEVLAVEFKSSEDANASLDAMQKRIDEQKAIFESYTPDEFYKLDGSSCFVSGKYGFVVATSDNTKAIEIIKGYTD